MDMNDYAEAALQKTLTMTLRYAYLAPSHKVKAVDILDNALNGMPTAHLLHSLNKQVDSTSAKCVTL